MRLLERECRLRKISLVILLFSSITILSGCNNMPRDKSDWFASDKFQHFASSGIAAAALAKETQYHNASECGGFTFSVTTITLFGAGKEIYDERVSGKYWSYKDMAWNIFGATVGAATQTDCF